MTLRRTQSPIEHTELGHLKLYRDDLIKIAKILAEIGPLEIKCGDWEGDDPTDFDSPDLPERLPGVEMTATDGTIGVGVRLKRNEAIVIVAEPTSLTEGVLSRIQRITKPRRRAVTAVRYDMPGGPKIAIRPISAKTPVVRSSALLINDYRENRPTFWERTRDDWIVGAVWCVVGLVLGGVIGYWVNTIT
ncbi:hypothetical protein [Actinoallomurus rhizosphaericola]|uniref:hypothetical protein n=1 Tax=Actinoallomurus rhizosphaericola TaxID=2952536 RepID=UPI0020930E12|nr:hypothetical protein [Actinoallomurus rhizosphaericola]MCO6000138.1 hypothetical protein [Actinoallomurus rhizosphaericola]